MFLSAIIEGRKDYPRPAMSLPITGLCVRLTYNPQRNGMKKLDEIYVACNLALFKAGIGVVDEIKGLVEIGKKHIEKFENMQSTSQQFSAGYYK